MRYLLLSLFLLLQLNAETTQRVTVGLGPYIQTQPYKGVESTIIPSPVIFFEYSLFYVRWSQFGLYFLGEEQEDYAWAFSLSAQPRPYGYESSDSSYLEGMDKRENTFEGGLAFSAKYKESYIEIMLLTDMLARNDSWILKTEIGDRYRVGDFSFYPSAILIYQSQKFVEYYYGVKASEENLSLGRYAYTPKGGFSLGLQTYIRYPITKNWALLSNVRCDKISNDAAKSPLTNQDYIYSGLVSLIYTFEQ